MKLGRVGTIAVVAGAAVAAGAAAYYASGGAAKAATPAGGTTPKTGGSNPPANALLLTDGAMTIAVGSTTQYVWAPAGGVITSATPTLGASALLDYQNTAVAIGGTNQYGLVAVVWKDAAGAPHVTAITAVNPNPAGGATQTLTAGAMTLPAGGGEVLVPQGASIVATAETGSTTVSTPTVNGQQAIAAYGSGTATITWTAAGSIVPQVTIITVP